MTGTGFDRYAQIIEHATRGVVVQDSTGRIVAANLEAERLLGIPRDALFGRTSHAPEWRAVRPDGTPFPGDEHPAMVALRRGVVVRGVLMGVHVPGVEKTRWLRIDAVPLREPGEQKPHEAVAYFDDVTAQEEAGRLFEAVLDAIPDVIGIQDTEHCILRYNRAGYQVVGPPEATHGRHCYELIGRSSPCDDCATRVAIRTGAPARIDRDSPELGRCFDVRAYPIKDEAGRVVKVVEHLHDVTAERRALAERDALREQLLHAQKLEAVGRLAGGVAHDFNNLLTVIAGFAEMLLSDLPGEQDRRHAREIRRAADRAAEMTRQLLAFSRQQPSRPRPLDLNAVLSDVERMLRRLLGEDVRLEVRAQPGLWPVMAHPGQMEQVLTNLVTNARDAMPDGGLLVVSTANVEVGPAGVRGHPGLAPGPFVRLSVRDHGQGMTEEVRSRLFEPFFTTKPLGKGTGLGLATVYGLVAQHGGFLEVLSKAGEGCEMQVHLPRLADAAPVEEEKERGAAAEPHGTELVLLVEDEEQLRELVRRFLGSLGYRVLAARDATDALNLLAVAPAQVPDLLLTDLVMPGTPGRELAATLVGRWPGLKVLFMTGWSGEPGGKEPPRGPPVLHKPFDRGTLARALRAALAR